MSILSRIKKIAGSAGRAAANSFDVVRDVSTAAWDDSHIDDIGDLFEHIGGYLADARGASGRAFERVPVVGHLVNVATNNPAPRVNPRVQAALDARRQGGVGVGHAAEAVGGAFPAPVRAAARSVGDSAKTGVTTTLNALDTVYREGVAEPFSAALTAASLMDDAAFQKSLQGKSWLERTTLAWKYGYETAQDRSPGQALAYAFLTKHITDQDEVDEAAGSLPFAISSAAADATLRIYADPFTIATRTASGARAGMKAGEVADFLNRARTPGPIARATEFVKTTVASHGDDAPAVIRARLWPSRNTVGAAAMSTALTDAAKIGDEAIDLTWRHLLGDPEALDALRYRSADLADRLGVFTRGRNSLIYKTNAAAQNALMLGVTPTDKVMFQLASDAVDQTAAELARVDRTVAQWGTLRELPPMTRRGDIRTAFVRSDFYQSSPWSRPLHVLNDMRPQRVLNLHDASGDVHISRALAESKVDLAVQDRLRSAYIRAGSPGARAAVVDEVEETLIQSAVNKARLTADEEARLRAAIKGHKDNLTEALGRAYSTDDAGSVVRILDDEGVMREVRTPIHPTQYGNYKFLPDAKKLTRIAEQIGAHRARYATAQIADELLGKFNAIWKPATLLSFRWPIRVVGEEQVRILTQIGALEHVKSLYRGTGSRLKDELDVAGRIFEPAFGPNGDNIMRQVVSETASTSTHFYGHNDAGLYDQLHETVKSWKMITPDMPEHAAAWEHAVNNQLAQSGLGRRLLANGNDPVEAAEWLTRDPAGIKFARSNKVRAYDPEAWAEAVSREVDALLPSAELQAAALDHAASYDALKTIYPTSAAMPNVNGQHLAETIGDGAFGRLYAATIDKAMTFVAKRPTVALSRQPFFNTMYRNEVERLATLATERGVPLTDELVRQIADRGRDYALGQTRELLFELAEDSQLAETLKFVAPFADATREVVTRWAGIAWKQPDVIRKITTIWRAPEAAGIVYDEEGNRIRQDGKAVTPDGDIVDPVGGKYIRIHIPEGVPLPGGAKVLRDMQFSKDSFNTILANPFGVGPLVNLAVGQMVKDNPSAQERLKFLFPYGVSDSPIQALMPTTLKRLTESSQDDSRFATQGYIFNRLYVEWQQNGADPDERPTMEQAGKMESLIHNVRLGASVFSPVGIQFISPYQPYIEAYRKLQNEDPSTASMRFYEQYGPEFFAVTNAVSRSVDGVPPTLEAWQERAKYKRLIEEHPELGSLIIGQVGGEFSQSVYRQQKQSRVGPNDDRRQRERVPSREFAVAPEVNSGWIEFSKAMDLIDVERQRRGLPNLRIKAAQDLAALKKQVIESLRASHPAWAAEYDKDDPAAYEKRIRGFRQLVREPSLRDRLDIAPLRSYLQARDAISAELTRRQGERGGSGLLDSATNGDLAALWATITSRLVADNPMFGPVFNRYLDRDTPKAGE